MIRTFETRIGKQDTGLAGVLDALAVRFNTAKRKAFALKAAIAADASNDTIPKKKKRKWDAPTYSRIYQDVGLNSSYFRSVTTEMNAQLDAATELTKLQITSITEKIAAKAKQIDKKQSALDKARGEMKDSSSKLEALEAAIALRRAKLGAARPSGKAKALVALKKALDKAEKHRSKVQKLPNSIKRVKFDLHQHKRRLGVLNDKLVLAKARLKFPSIAFGTKKLFNAQHNLRENRYRNRKHWKKDWQDARNNAFLLVGAAHRPCGNEQVRLKFREDGHFDLELRLPPGLAHLATSRSIVSGCTISSITLTGLSFNVGNEAVAEALADKRPLTFRFLRDGKSWKIYVTIKQPMVYRKADWSKGALGVDLNVGHVAVTHMDVDGNPVETWKIPCDLYGKSSKQSLDILRKAAVNIRKLSQDLGNLPVVSERLDFSAKKNRLTTDDGARYARMLSSFAYASFDAALASALRRASIVHWWVNPAFTSIIGRVKFVRRYGLSVHAAAALCVARRAAQFSERLPNPSGGILEIPTCAGGQIALSRPERIGDRHVWSSWGKVGRGYKAALATHRKRKALGLPSTGGIAVQRAA